LLCDVGKVLWEEHVDLAAAKIGTMGERAEDVFYLTDGQRRPLGEAAAARLRSRLLETLSAPDHG
jgi:[protein-PII] uridylyltransferase